MNANTRQKIVERFCQGSKNHCPGHFNHKPTNCNPFNEDAAFLLTFMSVVSASLGLESYRLSNFV